jgi:Domain of unknown function (DUF4390)
VAASLTSGREARDCPRLRRGPAAFQLLLALVCAGLCYAPESRAQGRFEIRSAYIERAEGVYQLSATLDFEVGEGARAAVRDGAPFTLNLEIVVRRERSYWLDEAVATLDQSYELVYHALSDRYLVRNLNSGEQASYATLDAAFDALRVISNLPILDQALVRPQRRHEISLRASLDVRTMPDTLRFILFWSDDWRQRSEWYTWSPRL